MLVSIFGVGIVVWCQLGEFFSFLQVEACMPNLSLHRHRTENHTRTRTRLPPYTHTAGTLAGELPLRPRVRTLYSIIGDLWAYICMFKSLCCIAIACVF